MHFSLHEFVLLAAIPVLALAQVDPGPSPTASFGCEPHGDHWHCDGANPTGALVQSSSPVAVITTSTSAAAASTSSAAGDDHDHDEHGEDDHDEDEHTDAAGTGTLAPSPTNSVGCEPHGDHWHCDAPRTALTTVAPVRTIAISNTTTAPTSASSTSVASTSANAQSIVPTGGAVALSAGVVGGFLGLVGAFAL